MNIFSPKQQALSLGTRGEKSAINYLKKCGYRILATTNFFNPKGRRMGEIDIVAQDSDMLVFLEVKTRTISSLNSSPLPEESVNKAKLHKLNKIASFYIAKNKLFEKNYRFDVISILADIKNNQAKLKHIKNSFL